MVHAAPGLLGTAVLASPAANRNTRAGESCVPSDLVLFTLREGET